MKFDSTPYLLHMLLLAELIVHASSRPTPGAVGGASLCSIFASMKHHVESLRSASKHLHQSIDETTREHLIADGRLESLPHMPHSAAYFLTLKVNQSLSEMYLHAQSFMLHIDWLITAKEDLSVPSHSAGGAAAHLRDLSSLIRAALQQIDEETPEPPSPSLPAVSTAFDTLHFSVEIGERLKHFCTWSKRVLLQLVPRCARH